MTADVQVATGEHESAEYSLFERKLRQDINLFINYKNQMSCLKAAEYHEKLSYQVSRSKHAEATMARVLGNNKGDNLGLDKYQWIGLTDKSKGVDLQATLTEYMGRSVRSYTWGQEP